MKNKILFLMLGMFLLISLGSVSATEGDYVTSYAVSGGCGALEIWGDYAYIEGGGYTGTDVTRYFLNNFTNASSIFSVNGYNMDTATDGTYLWYGSDTGEKVSKYWLNGTLHSTFDTSAQGGGGNPRGVTTDNSSLWVINSGGRIDRYNMAGAFQDYITLIDGNGLQTNGTFIWAVSASTNKMYKYFTNGTSHSEWDLNTTNANAIGIGFAGNNIYVCDSSLNRIFKYLGASPDVSSILVNKIYPLNNSILTYSNLFNVSLSMTGTNLSYSWKNNTYYIWYSNGTSKNTTTVTGLSTNSSSTSKLFTLGFGNYIWDSSACYNNVTFGNCSWSSGNSSFSINSSINSETHNAVGYETASETYTLNLTSPTTPTNAYLVYNGTSYAATLTSSGGNIYTLSKTLQIPTTQIGNNTFYYTWNLSSTFAENTTIYNQYINNTLFGLCNSTLTVPYLNITFKDEATDGYINATVPSSTFTYYLGDGSITKTLTYSQTANQTNYTFCGLPSNKTYYVDSYLQYKLGTDYPQRIWNPALTSYTNVTTNVTLYLLSSTDGIYVTFQLVNTADQVISGVTATATREIDGVNVTVGTGTTGSDGTVTFWMNPDFSHYLNFSKSGYTTYLTSLIPTQTSYTITLSSSTSSVSSDYTRGIKIYSYPKSKELFNNTIYGFIFNVTSSYWELNSFGFNLRLANGTIVGSGSSLVEGTGASLNYNTSNQTIIYMDYYWKVNNTYTNSTIYWIVTNSLNTDWSIKTFFTDLDLYLDSGIFGLDDFGRYLIAFLVLFLIVGIMGYKYGMTSPVFISVLTFSVVFFLDTIAGLLPAVRGIEHLVTYVAGLIMVLVIINEVAR